MERSGLRFENFSSKKGVKSPRRKKWSTDDLPSVERPTKRFRGTMAEMELDRGAQKLSVLSFSSEHCFLVKGIFVPILFIFRSNALHCIGGKWGKHWVQCINWRT